MTRQQLLQPGWEVPTPSPCAPDTATWDFHLFRSLQNSLHGKKKKLNSLEDCKGYLEEFFVQEDKKFGEDEIMKFSERWQEIMEQNSEKVVQ